MAYIRVIDEGEAGGDLGEIYKRVAHKRGKVSNILKIHSLNPRVMESHLNLYMDLMFGRSKLKREEREMLAVIVSKANKCEYCVNHHLEALNFYWKDENKIRGFLKDYKSLNLSDRHKYMLDFAVKLTTNPSEITRENMEVLRKAGFTDEEIHDIVCIVAYFNFVNRVALGLGVEFDENEVKGYKY